MITVPRHRFGQWLLNRRMARMIPFNRPHGITIVSLDEGKAVCHLPFAKKNWNHLQGLHACALITVAEYAAGILLVQLFSTKRYRIIMASLEVCYHRQGLTDCLAISQCCADQIDQLKLSLEQEGKGWITLESVLHDMDNKLLATVKTNWQLKLWEKIK